MAVASYKILIYIHYDMNSNHKSKLLTQFRLQTRALLTGLVLLCQVTFIFAHEMQNHKNSCITTFTNWLMNLVTEVYKACHPHSINANSRIVNY